MNKLSIVLASGLTAAMLFCQSATAAVPPIEDKGVPAVTTCPTTLQQYTAGYSDKIVFKIIGTLIANLPADQPALDKLPRGTELDIKVRDNPKYVANIKNKVLTFLGAQPGGNNVGSIQIVDVSYTAIVCPKSP